MTDLRTKPIRADGYEASPEQLRAAWWRAGTIAETLALTEMLRAQGWARVALSITPGGRIKLTR